MTVSTSRGAVRPHICTRTGLAASYTVQHPQAGAAQPMGSDKSHVFLEFVNTHADGFWVFLQDVRSRLSIQVERGGGEDVVISEC